MNAGTAKSLGSPRLGDVQFVGRELAYKPRLENVTTTALPKVEDHLTPLRVESGGSCRSHRRKTLIAAGAVPRPASFVSDEPSLDDFGKRIYKHNRDSVAP